MAATKIRCWATVKIVYDEKPLRLVLAKFNAKKTFKVGRSRRPG